MSFDKVDSNSIDLPKINKSKQVEADIQVQPVDVQPAVSEI